MVENIIQNTQEKPIDFGVKMWYSYIKERERNKKLPHLRGFRKNQKSNLLSKFYTEDFGNSEMQYQP